MARQSRLKAHPQLIIDVIRRQTGSLDKAVLEGCMNAIEAKASCVEISFNPDGIEVYKPGSILSIRDNGKGISTEEEIDKFFETFGTPHEESEEKIWAQFRMGRGQLFSFGKNVWRTGPFQMTVDIEKDGLDYTIEDNLDIHEGCSIFVNLYSNPIGTYNFLSLDAFKDSIRKQVQFVEVPILFNNEQINSDPHYLQWTYEDENAYYLFNSTSELKIYNLGVYVRSLSITHTGVGGVVVSKRQIKVNFARNDIHHDCPVYASINEVIKDNRIKKTRKSSRRLTNDERIAALFDVRDNLQDFDSVKNIGLLTTSSGRFITLYNMKQHKSFWTFAHEGNSIADKLMQSNVALCLDDLLPETMGYNGHLKDFFAWLMRNVQNNKQWDHLANLYRDFNILQQGYSQTNVIIPNTKMKTTERRILKVLSRMYHWDGRTIVLGLSDVYDAWTDGSTYIAINRSFLSHLNLSWGSGPRLLLAVLTHELAHSENTCNSHIHGEDFYRRFHDICMNRQKSPLDIIGSFSAAMKQSRIEECRVKENHKIEKTLGIA